AKTFSRGIIDKLRRAIAALNDEELAENRQSPIPTLLISVFTSHKPRITSRAAQPELPNTTLVPHFKFLLKGARLLRPARSACPPKEGRADSDFLGAASLHSRGSASVTHNIY